MTAFALDILTRPDVESGRRLYQLTGLGDRDVARVMYNKGREQTGRESLPPHLCQIVAVSYAGYSAAEPGTIGQFEIGSLRDDGAGEGDLLGRVFTFLEEKNATLLTWNRRWPFYSLFVQRALINSVSSEYIFSAGGCLAPGSGGTDVMRLLTGRQRRQVVDLCEISTLLDLPGHVLLRDLPVGDDLGDSENEKIGQVTALSIFLVYQHWLVSSGTITRAELSQVRDAVHEALSSGSSLLHEILDPRDHSLS